MTPDDSLEARLREEYGRPLPDEAGARQRALERLRREAFGPAPGRAVWWFDRDALRMTPALTFAVLVVAVALGAWGGARWTGAHVAPRAAPIAGRSPATSVVPAWAADRPTMVTFAFRAPGAARVSLVGDFNGWDAQATPLRRAVMSDVWTTDIALPSGLHAYAFVIDGDAWSVDPSAPLAPETAFGRRNALLVVAERGAL